MAYEMTLSRKLSEISQLGNRQTRSFRRLDHDQKREVVERLDTITAEKLRAEVKKLGRGSNGSNR